MRGRKPLSLWKIFDKIGNRCHFLKKLWMLIPIAYFCGIQITNAGNHSFKLIPLPLSQISRYQFGMVTQLGYASAIESLPLSAGDIRGLGFEMSDKGNQVSPAIGNSSIALPSSGKPIVSLCANKPAKSTGQYQFYGLWDDLIEICHYLIVAIIAGFTASFFSTRKLAHKPPNDS